MSSDLFEFDDVPIHLHHPKLPLPHVTLDSVPHHHHSQFLCDPVNIALPHSFYDSLLRDLSSDDPYPTNITSAAVAQSQNSSPNLSANRFLNQKPQQTLNFSQHSPHVGYASAADFSLNADLVKESAPFGFDSSCIVWNNDGVTDSYRAEGKSTAIMMPYHHQTPVAAAFDLRLLESLSSPSPPLASDYVNVAVGSPANSFTSGELSSVQNRTVYSTEDLQVKKNSLEQSEGTQMLLCSSPLGSESSGMIMEEVTFKVGIYTAEERKEKIDRYRAKRRQRNFNKTIKYACRKTLADNRLRVRGRFARKRSEMGTSTSSNGYEEEDDIEEDELWPYNGN